MNRRNADTNRFARWAAGIGIALFLFGLALFAYTGTYARFWADDYCYSSMVKQMGLIQGLVGWYRTSGNRLSTLVVVAFTDLFGWRSIQFISFGVLALWVGAWIFFLRQLRRLLDWPVTGFWLALLALVEVYFAVLLAPDRLQTIYWRMGTFHYTLPMPLLLINLGFLAASFEKPLPLDGPRKMEEQPLPQRRAQGSYAKVRKGKNTFFKIFPLRFFAFFAVNLFTRWRLIGVMLASGLLGLFAAGLSETFAAMQAGGLALAIIAALALGRGSNRRQVAQLLAAPLAGTIVMMVIMMLAPANSWRQAVMPPPSNPLLVIPYSLRYAADFILYTIRGQIIPFLVYGAIVAVIAFLCAPPGMARLRLRALLVGVAIALAAMYLLIICSFAPSAYANLAYPAGRALMPGGFALLAGLGTAATLLGLAARQVLGLPASSGASGTSFRRRLTVPAALVLLVAFSLYPLRAMTVVRADIARLAVRAERWDARNAEILQELAAGKQDIQVRQVDVVQTLEDMGPDPSQWINGCASDFYGARSITASP